MGRCQAGFCTPKLVGILAKELNISQEEVTKFGRKSLLLVGRNKEI
jgi:glycerol-3-phosphate dehydrogenase